MSPYLRTSWIFSYLYLTTSCPRPHLRPPACISCTALPYNTNNPSSATTRTHCKHQRPAQRFSPVIPPNHPSRHTPIAFLTSPPSVVTGASFPLPHSKAHRPPLPPNRPPGGLSARCCKSGLIHVPRCSTPPSPLLRRHRPSSDRPAAALSSCSQRRPLHSRPLPAVRALHYSLRQTEPDTSCCAPLPPNRRLYSSR